jgi:VCBS repeat-containing protein
MSEQAEVQSEVPSEVPATVDWQDVTVIEDGEAALEALKSDRRLNASLDEEAVSETVAEDTVVVDFSQPEFIDARYSLVDGALVVEGAEGGVLTLDGFEDAASGGLFVVLPDGSIALANQFLAVLGGDMASIEPAAGPDADHGGGANFAAYDAAAGLGGLDATGTLDPTSLGSRARGSLGDGGNAGDAGLNGQDPEAFVASEPSRAASIFNEKPVAADDSGHVSEDSSILLDLLANDRDPDEGDGIRLHSIDREGLTGDVTILDDGTVRYDPNGQFEHLGKGETATDTFSYTVVDGSGAKSTAEVEMTIVGENDDPIATRDYGYIDEDTSFVFEARYMRFDDSDVDGDRLKVISVQNAENGTVSMEDGIVTFTPDPDYYGYTFFEYTISDGNGGFATGDVKMAVYSVNDAPVAESISIHASENDDAIIIDLNDLVSDVDRKDILAITDVEQTGGDDAVFSVLDGVVTVDPDQFDSLFDGDSASIELTYTVQDDSNEPPDSAQGTVTIDIAGVTDGGELVH